MNYKYPPIYKYGLFFIATYMFLKHQQLMTSDKLLVNSIIITLIMAIIDYIIIYNHPSLFKYFSNKQSANTTIENFRDEINNQEIEEIINAYDMSIAKELESDEDEDETVNYRENENMNNYNNMHENFNPTNKHNKANMNRQYFNTSNMTSY